MVTRWGVKGENRARHRAVPIYCAAALLVLGWDSIFDGLDWVPRHCMVLAEFLRCAYGERTRFRGPRLSSIHSTTWAHCPWLSVLAPDKRHVPTGYYATTSGAGRAIVGLQSARGQFREAANMRIGVVGLGASTLAAYGRKGDYIRFYEINPEVVGIASDERYFSYLKGCAARLEVIPGECPHFNGK